MSINQENDVKKGLREGGRVARLMRNKIKYIFNLKEKFPPSQRVAKITPNKKESNFQKNKNKYPKLVNTNQKKACTHTHTHTHTKTNRLKKLNGGGIHSFAPSTHVHLSGSTYRVLLQKKCSINLGLNGGPFTLKCDFRVGYIHSHQ
jgi:exosome complex RNA-binding protein Rrp4